MWIRNASRCFGGVGDAVTHVLKAKLKGIAHSKQGRYWAAEVRKCKGRQNFPFYSLPKIYYKGVLNMCPLKLVHFRLKGQRVFTKSVTFSKPLK